MKRGEELLAAASLWSEKIRGPSRQWLLRSVWSGDVVVVWRVRHCSRYSPKYCREECVATEELVIEWLFDESVILISPAG